MIDKNLPIYELYLKGDEDGMECISFVDYPAIESKWMLFDEHKPIQLSKDNKKHIVFGPALIPDFLIYRRDTDNTEYYIKFSAETIEAMLERWSKQGLTNEINLMHNHNLVVEDCTIMSMFLKNSEMGINPTGYEDLPDNTLFVSYKITPKLWDMIEKGEVDLNGFSIEAYMSYKRIEMSQEPKDLIDEILNDKDLKKKVKQSKFYTVGEITDMMNAEKVYDIKYDGKTYSAQIYSITDNGAGIEIMTADKKAGENTWHNLRISEIDDIKVTNDPYIPWEVIDNTSFNDYINSEHTVSRSVVAPSDNIDDMIKNRNIVIINYDDKKNNPTPPEGASHTSARQCAIIARGQTHLGNECIRVWQYFGDSRSVAEGYADGLGDYRLLLIKRITQMRVVPFADPWTEDELGIGLNSTGDNGMADVFYHYSYE